MTNLALNKIEKVIYDNYPITRVSSKSNEHVLTVMIPKNHRPDFYIESTGYYVEVKGYVKDKEWWRLLKNMPPEMKSIYKVVFHNPDLQSPLTNLSYGDYLTAYGIDWCKWPHLKDSWLVNNDNLETSESAS